MIAGIAPYHCNREYPHRLYLQNAAPNLEIQSLKATAIERRGNDCTVKVPIVGKSAGRATVAGELRFSVCTDSSCRMEQRNIATDVEVR